MRRMIGAALAAALCVMGAGLTSGPAALAQPASGSVVVVFDSSGSMWGKLPGGNAKFEDAYAALRASLPQPDTEIATGLIVFGPGCGRATVMAPPGVRSPDETLNALPGLNPRSKGPVADGMEQALALIEETQQATIILVADGPDNCRRDSCSLASSMATGRPGLKVHVVGLGIDAAPPELACFASETGGRFFPAATADEANSAIASAADLAMTDLAPRRARPVVRDDRPTARPPPELDPEGPPHLVLSARTGDVEEPIAKPVRWRVYKGAGAPVEDARPVLDVLEPQFAAPIEPGIYHVRAELGRAVFAEDVTVAGKGPSKLTARFDAGTLKLRVVGSGGDVIGVASVVTVSSEAAEGAPRRPVIMSPFRDSELVLPAGRYRLRAQSGSVSAERIVAIEAGGRQEVDLALPVGEVQVSTSGDITDPRRNGIVVAVEVDDPEAESGRRTIARSATRDAVFRLPAGTYSLEAAQGLARARTRVAVGAGQRVSAALRLAAARLAVKAAIPPGPDQKRRPVIFKLYDRDTLEVIAQSSVAEPEFIVPPGRYRVIAEIGTRNVRAVEDVDLAAGGDALVTLAVNAGDVRLRVADGAGRPVTGQFWEVVDAAGARVWRTQQSVPRGLLAPGRYKVRAETRSGVVEGEFDLAAGESKTVELRVP